MVGAMWCNTVLWSVPYGATPSYSRCGVVQHCRCGVVQRSVGVVQASELTVQKCKEGERRPKPDPNNLVFGAHYSDHMLEVEWRTDRGWGKPHISPLHDLTLHPGSKVLHYASEV